MAMPPFPSECSSVSKHQVHPMSAEQAERLSRPKLSPELVRQPIASAGKNLVYAPEYGQYVRVLTAPIFDDLDDRPIEPKVARAPEYGNQRVIPVNPSEFKSQLMAATDDYNRRRRDD